MVNGIDKGIVKGIVMEIINKLIKYVLITAKLLINIFFGAITIFYMGTALCFITNHPDGLRYTASEADRGFNIFLGFLMIAVYFILLIMLNGICSFVINKIINNTVNSKIDNTMTYMAESTAESSTKSKKNNFMMLSVIEFFLGIFLFLIYWYIIDFKFLWY